MGRQKIPDSGIRKFINGCRVHIPSMNVVGTVIDYDSSGYLVRFMNHKGVLNTIYFKESALIEQLSLPFEEIPF